MLRFVRYAWLFLARRPLLLVVILLASGGVGLTANYFAQDYMENDPTFCNQCHVMESAFEAWKQSVHRGINCHECHHATTAAKNKMLLQTIFLAPEKVTDPYVKTKGTVNVPFEYCVKCHWRKNPDYPNAPKINQSMGHALHVYVQEIECAQCHAGQSLHVFPPAMDLCLNCHEGQVDYLHGSVAGEPVVRCLSCHTDKTRDIKPDRRTCLACHQQFGPDPDEQQELMHLQCTVCHKPHDPELTKPKPEVCLGCHKPIGEHEVHALHLDAVGNCTDCHRAHHWRFTVAEIEETCGNCHEPLSPEPFYLPHLKVSLAQ
ncbi:MAG TPA: NapC/NirT family cytochrome c [bacterium]